MKLSKFPHSCVGLEKDGVTLVIDPGVFSDAASVLQHADAVLITHEHPDHVDVPAVLEAMRANPDLAIFAPASLRGQLPAATITAPGERFEAVGFAVECFGGQHALIHSSVPVIPNVAYLIDEALYHPGDSFVVPNKPVAQLLIPVHAPWSKVAEVLDFAIAVRAEQSFAIHDVLLNQNGLGFINQHLKRVGGIYDLAYEYLTPGAELTL